MKRTEHEGTVVSIQGDNAVIHFKMSPSCEATFRCACCASPGRETRSIRVARGSLEVGDRVQIFVPAYVGYLSTFVVFVLPMILFVAGLAVGGLFEEKDAGRDLPTLVGGVCGFLLGVAAARAANRKIAGGTCFDIERLERGSADGGPQAPPSAHSA